MPTRQTETAAGSDPEFFVLWLDRTEGSDQAVHSTGIPNIGIHLADRGPRRGKNVFMVRFGSKQTAWSRTELQPGKTYHVIARIAKQKSGTRNAYSQIQLWVEPQSEDADQPLLSLDDQDGIHQVRWVGFLPARFQGTQLDNQRGVPYFELPALYSVADRREQLDFIHQMNRQHLKKQNENSELEARIESYELGFRMQLNAPEILDLSKESEATQKMYGIDQKASSVFGRHCLLVRRLVEQGVRFIQLRNGGWDAHGSLKSNHTGRCRATDLPIAGLLQDLKQRNLLEQTLVIWGGEFGRTPTTEGNQTGDRRGRDHSPAGYTMWLAGGGIKGGQVIGATDELGFVPVERPLSPHEPPHAHQRVDTVALSAGPRPTRTQRGG